MAVVGHLGDGCITIGRLRTMSKLVAEARTRKDHADLELKEHRHVPGVPQRFLWLLVLVIFLCLAAGSALRVASRPVIEMLFALSGGTYGMVQCAVDVVIILFYAVCTVVGLYSRSRLLPLSMHNLRPVPYSTSLLTLLGNCAMLQTLSFALPVIVWLFGLGPREAMKLVASQYGYISVLQSTYLTRGFLLGHVLLVALLGRLIARHNIWSLLVSLIKGHQD